MKPIGGGNADQAEIHKFERLADHWWDTRGALKSLHDINPLRLGYIEARLRLGGKRVLDVGCGGGILAEAMARKGARVTGIDLGSANLAVAAAHARRGGLSIVYRQASVEAFAQRCGGRFDLVTCMELLEHVPSAASVVFACRRLVRPGGHVILATINRNPKSYLFAIVGAEYLLRLLPRGTHRYRRFVKPSEIREWARRTGLAWRDVTGLHYNPLTRRYALGGNLHVNYLVHLQRIGNSMPEIIAPKSLIFCSAFCPARRRVARGGR
jgi:2-polyprenyl-6-hydroxyphenyl methylase/3-demethylubiquinone-9 3-methyltransferase